MLWSFFLQMLLEIRLLPLSLLLEEVCVEAGLCHGLCWVWVLDLFH